MNPYDCSVCHNEGYDHAADCPYHPDNLAAAAAEQENEMAQMSLFGQSDPAGSDGYIPGAWDQVRHAYLDGHITEEAYEVLHAAMQTLKAQTEAPPTD